MIIIRPIINLLFAVITVKIFRIRSFKTALEKSRRVGKVSDPSASSFPARSGSPTMYPGFPLNLTDNSSPAASTNCVWNVWTNNRSVESDEMETRLKRALIFTTPLTLDQ